MNLLLRRLIVTGTSVVAIAIPTLSAAQSVPPSGVTIPPNAPDVIDQSIPTPSDLTPTSPVETPTTPPAPSLETPEIQPQPDTTPLPSVQFPITMVEVVGNTVLQDEIDTLTRSFENREVTFEDLVALRTEITQLYIQNGYVTSGAFLPNNQDLSSGVVQIQVVEGELERIDISGLRHLRTAYVRDRIELGTSNPLNQYKLQESLQLLQLNPLIRSVNAELTAGSAPGRSILLVNVVEAPSFHVGVGGNNYQSPSIGSEQISVSVEHGNVLGFGDRLSAGYGLTDGLDSFNVSYAIPINSLDGTLNLSYNNDESTIIADDFADLDIRSESETFSINFRQPLSKSPTSEFALGLGLDLRRSQTYSVSHIG